MGWNCGWRWDNKAIPFLSFVFAVFYSQVTPIVAMSKGLKVLREIVEDDYHKKNLFSHLSSTIPSD
jgi:hypothetical protein